MKPNAVTLAEPIEIGRFFKNRRHDIVAVQIKSYEGVVFCDIRQFFENDAGQNCPTKKGIGITLHKLPELVSLLEKAIEKASELGLLDRDARP
jgi:hypothetical protein